MRKTVPRSCEVAQNGAREDLYSILQTHKAVVASSLHLEISLSSVRLQFLHPNTDKTAQQQTHAPLNRIEDADVLTDPASYLLTHIDTS